MEQSKIGLLLAKAETTYGTDPTPTGAANNIAVVRGQVQLDIDGEPWQRDILDAGRGVVIGGVSRPKCALKFRTELRGNRTTGTGMTDIANGSATYKLEIDPLLQACDLAAAYTAESAGSARDGYVIYTPTVAQTEGQSVTFYFYSGSKLYKATGAKGNIEAISIEADKIGFIDWSFIGMYQPVTDASIPASPAFLATKPPLFSGANRYVAQAVTLTNATELVNLNAHGLFNGDRVKFGGTVPTELTAGTWYYVVNTAANTFKVSATLGGSVVAFSGDGTNVTITTCPALLFGSWEQAVFSRITAKLGNTVDVRVDANSVRGIKGAVITNRQSGLDLDPESITEATHPMWADWLAGTAKNVRLQVGTQSGNRCVMEFNAQLSKVGYEDRNGRRIQNVSLACGQSNPGDTPGSEFKLLFQ